MIFVTVGTELPFDRMIRPIDAWAARAGRSDVFAQIGPTDWQPAHIKWAKFLDATECRARIAEATVVIAHAGMGSILTALELGKPIVVMPRRADLKEHRSDHQLATVRQLSAQGRVTAVMDEGELLNRLEHLEELSAPGKISPFASEQLLRQLSYFIDFGTTDTKAPSATAEDHKSSVATRAV